MGCSIHDGSAGRRFVLNCDTCGATLAADSLEGRDAARYAAGWNGPAGRRDLCAGCATQDGSPRLARSILFS